MRSTRSVQREACRCTKVPRWCLLLMWLLALQAAAAPLQMQGQWFELRAGAPGVHMEPWQAMWAPKNTPKDVIAKLNGAREVYACATHGVLCGEAIGRLRDAFITQVIITDTIPLTPEKQLPHIKVLSVAPLLADAIKRIHFNESVSRLFT